MACQVVQPFTRKNLKMEHSPVAADNPLKELFTDKPEMVIDYPEWLLSTRALEAYRNMSRMAVVEIAGRDSVAAAVESVESSGFTDLLPTYVYTGTEYGPWSSVETAVERLARRLPEVRVHPLLVLGSPRFWKALNGSFVSELISTYGFYTPCVGCHLYLHAVRIPLALSLGAVPVISGEREQHNGSVKLNQIPEALDRYIDLAKRFGVRLIFPLRQVYDGRIINDLLGLNWKEGQDQLACSLSGNYRLPDGSVSITSRQVERFIDEFAGPCSEKIIASYLEGHVPEHDELAARVLRKL